MKLVCVYILKASRKGEVPKAIKIPPSLDFEGTKRKYLKRPKSTCWRHCCQSFSIRKKEIGELKNSPFCGTLITLGEKGAGGEDKSRC